MERFRVLVTGGAGFIGSNLTDALLAQGHRVVVLDDFSTGKRQNLAHLAGNPDFDLIEGDIRNPEDCRKAVEGADYVFHEAAIGSVPRSVKNPGYTVSVNTYGFVNMLFAAKEAGVKRFIYASSSSVYGDDATFPKVENRIGTQLSPYAVSKYTDELFAENFHRLYGIDTIGLRYFNVFGRRQDPESVYAAVIPAFARDLIRHKAPVINGDGSNSRDFTYIDNVIQANLLAMRTQNPDAVNQVYNVACEQRTDLNQLFALLRENLAAFDPEINGIPAQHGPNREGDIPHSLASISKISGLLGYKPEYDAASGLAETTEWYYRNLK